MKTVLYWRQPEVPRAMASFLKDLGLRELVCAEIGVGHGVHAEILLKLLDIKKLFLIDPYEYYRGYFDASLPRLQEVKVIARGRLSRYETKIEWIYEKGVDSIKCIDVQLDFVYHDANHSYKAVLEEISAFFPLVKPGGFQGGHDYLMDKDRPGVFEAKREGGFEIIEVKEAVDEFVSAHSFTLFVGLNPTPEPDWWFRKEKS